MRLIFLCKIHNTKFDINSYCEKWELAESLKDVLGHGSSTKKKCDNCQHMPEYGNLIDRFYQSFLSTKIEC